MLGSLTSLNPMGEAGAGAAVEAAVEAVTETAVEEAVVSTAEKQGAQKKNYRWQFVHDPWQTGDLLSAIKSFEEWLVPRDFIVWYLRQDEQPRFKWIMQWIMVFLDYIIGVFYPLLMVTRAWHYPSVPFSEQPRDPLWGWTAGVLGYITWFRLFSKVF